FNLYGYANFMPGGTMAPGVLNLNGGVLGASNTVVARNFMDWSSGNIQGNSNVFALGGLRLTGGGFKTLDCKLINMGLAGLSAGNLLITDAGLLSNAPSGTIQITNSASSGGGVIANSGQFIVAPGANNTASLNSFFTNYATVQVQSGSLR